MDLCLIDWKALAPMVAAIIGATIASFTAFRISNRWSEQKGRETLASEAKIFYSSNNDILVSYKKLRDAILESPGTVGINHPDFIKLNAELENLYLQVDYFKNLLVIINSQYSEEYSKLSIRVKNFKKDLPMIVMYRVRVGNQSQGSHAEEIFNKLGFDAFVSNIKSINLILYKVILFK
ncbi:hypothetical protein ACG9X2_17030 [Acinetobacter bereziniae]|uniref:hypothetical protein n=1 Tax=Acinetobacter bereziniae TaxID=106648 RepID=UPI003AF676D1